MSAEEFGGLGFAPGSVKGVRSFRVDKFGRLTGIHYPQVWRPGENNAECRKNEEKAGTIVNYSGGNYSGSMTFTTWGTSTPSGHYYYAKPLLESKPPEPDPNHTMSTCKCGFYGYFDGSDDYHDQGRITAVVEAYGEAVIGTRGFRAMKARILAIRIKAEDDGVTGAMARKLSANYKGVAIFDNFEEMVAAFPPDVSLEPSPETDPDFWTRS